MINSKKADRKKVWVDEYTIRSYEVDSRRKITLPALGRFLQETAYHHAHNLELGYTHLKEKNQFWVLSRLLIKMFNYPVWGDRIEVHTWPTGVERLFAIRDFKIADNSGITLGVAVSSWIILDSEKRRPQRPDFLKEEIGHLVGEPALEERPVKIPNIIDSPKGPVFPVRYSDLDLYNHVNNVKYIEWILDSYPVEMHHESEISTFEINFLSEAKYGNEISIYTESPDDAAAPFKHCIKRVTDERDICLSRVGWVVQTRI